MGIEEGIVKREIRNREDVSLLVYTFYGKIRKHDVLGPIFNGIIKDWDEHLEKLVDFWESNLLYTRKYFGNPMIAHVSVDQKTNYGVTSKHFGFWLNLWYQTLDEYFEGRVAQLARDRARTMSTNLYLAIFRSRPKEAHS